MNQLMQSDEVQSFVELVGQRIRDRRRALGLSQEQLAKRVSLDRVSIVQIEMGQRKQVKPGLICKIAHALNIRAEDIYGIPTWVSRLSPSLSRVISKASNCPNSRQEELASIVETVLSSWHEPVSSP